MWLSRTALESYVAVRVHPACYGELYVPTLIHHLGHRVVDLGTVSDVLAYPSNDVLEVRAGEGSEPVFVPFVDDVVTQVDVVGRVVGVREDFL